MRGLPESFGSGAPNGLRFEAPAEPWLYMRASGVEVCILEF